MAFCVWRRRRRKIRVADVEGNAEVALAAVREATERGVRALVLPELNLTGYTAADLFHNRTLLHACEARSGAYPR